MTDKQIIENKNGFYCIEPCSEIKQLKEQLKAKEQECEELKEELLTTKCMITTQGMENGRLYEQLDQLKAENEELKEKINSLLCSENCYKYKQAEQLKQSLAEIKEIAEKAVKCLYTTESDDYTDGYRWLGGLILQKIRKCEVENERILSGE